MSRDYAPNEPRRQKRFERTLRRQNHRLYTIQLQWDDDADDDDEQGQKSEVSLLWSDVIVGGGVG